ncbi:hypothetical protein CEV32_3995 [Brucella rhizosphaerae]|uniref:Uncharacterized protein n=1 Tax=Brucella rhizosphaerae TaxID=571254 RepID=A0A256FR57_9HYPH|nr:hypothetical protein CEV32_3995 [Brucella rhizosphaerae]
MQPFYGDHRNDRFQHYSDMQIVRNNWRQAKGMIVVIALL